MITNYEIPKKVMDNFTKAYAAVVFGVIPYGGGFQTIELEDAVDLAEDFLESFKNWVEGRLT